MQVPSGCELPNVDAGNTIVKVNQEYGLVECFTSM